MIEKNDWFNAIDEYLEELSDLEFQRRVWVRGEGPEVASYAEFICGLFEDFSFEDFLDDSWGEWGFSENLHILLNGIKTDLLKFVDDGPSDDAEVIEDPRWQEISKNAVSALRQMRLERDLQAGTR